jgi:hypothetical protein
MPTPVIFKTGLNARFAADTAKVSEWRHLQSMHRRRSFSNAEYLLRLPPTPMVISRAAGK